jgi:iron complex transport system substrate-binding protein
MAMVTGGGAWWPSRSKPCVPKATVTGGGAAKHASAPATARAMTIKSTINYGTPSVAAHCVAITLSLLGLISPAIAQSAPITVIDSEGKPFTLAAPAKRIVAIAPHITELVFAAGAGHRLVATVDYGDYPPEAKKLPRVGSAFGVNVEAVAALKPDLVVAWQIEANKANLAQIRSLGIPVLLNEPRSFEGIADSIADLGKLAGTQATAQSAAQRMHAQVRALRQRYASAKPIKVFYQLTDKPLLTINQKHFISDAMALCGAVNVFASAVPLVPEVGFEGVLAAQPEVLVAASTAPANSPERSAWQTVWQRKLPSFAPVQAKRFVTLTADRMHRHTPRALEETGVLCEALDQFRNK